MPNWLFYALWGTGGFLGGLIVFFGVIFLAAGFATAFIQILSKMLNLE